MTEECKVNHPKHYGGKDNPYETIKVIEAWDLGFNLGNAIKYISRADKKGNNVEDLRKAAWYLEREIRNLEGRPDPNQSDLFNQPQGENNVEEK